MNTSDLIRRALLRGGRRPTVAGQSGTSRRRGEGYEFAELRSYVSGDDPRRIDWAATARAGSLQTRVVLEEHALILAAIVDDSESMILGRDRSRLDEAYEAMEIWYSAAKMGDRCIRVGSEEIVSPREARGFAAANICAQRSITTPQLEVALRNAYATLPAGSALLVISDVQVDISAESLFLLGARHDVTLLLARDPWHDGFPLRGFVRLQDCRTSEQEWFFVTKKSSARYSDAVIMREESIRLRFESAGWRFGLLDANPEDDLRTTFLPQGVSV
jgi:hypothetical protein